EDRHPARCVHAVAVAQPVADDLPARGEGRREPGRRHCGRGTRGSRHRLQAGLALVLSMRQPPAKPAAAGAAGAPLRGDGQPRSSPGLRPPARPRWWRRCPPPRRRRSPPPGRWRDEARSDKDAGPDKTKPGTEEAEAGPNEATVEAEARPEEAAVEPRTDKAA